MKKCLPISSGSFLSLPALANMYSILSLYSEGEIWFLENHINLVSFYKYDGFSKVDHRKIWIDFDVYDPRYIGRTWESCYYLRKKTHLRKFINERWNSFHEFCIDAINEDHYIFVTVNADAISEYSFSGRHQIFIHGYDEENGRFFCSDFFGKPLKYQRIWVRFEEIDKGYNEIEENGEIDDFEGVCLWNYKSNSFNYFDDYCNAGKSNINSFVIRKKLTQFVEAVSQSDILQAQNETKCGVEAIESYGIYVKKQAEISDYIEMHPIYVILDHLKLLKRLLTMCLGAEQNDLNGIIAMYKKISLIILKYNALCKRNDRDTKVLAARIYTEIMHAVIVETNYVRKIITEIRN